MGLSDFSSDLDGGRRPPSSNPMRYQKVPSYNTFIHTLQNSSFPENLTDLGGRTQLLLPRPSRLHTPRRTARGPHRPLDPTRAPPPAAARGRTRRVPFSLTGVHSPRLLLGLARCKRFQKYKAAARKKSREGMGHMGLIAHWRLKLKPQRLKLNQKPELHVTP